MHHYMASARLRHGAAELAQSVRPASSSETTALSSISSPTETLVSAAVCVSAAANSTAVASSYSTAGAAAVIFVDDLDRQHPHPQQLHALEHGQQAMSIDEAELDASVPQAPTNAAEISFAASRFIGDVVNCDPSRTDISAQMRSVQDNAAFVSVGTEIVVDARAQAGVESWTSSAAGGFNTATALFLTHQVRLVYTLHSHSFDC
jgi:hypothetical protein